MSTLHVLGNPAAGRAGRSAPAGGLRAMLETAGHDVVDLTGEDAEASTLALRDVVAAGSAERVIVAGGDGLVHLAIQELAGSDIVLAVAPSGTGNDFAAALGLGAPEIPPSDMAAATEGTADANTLLAVPVPVDLLEVETAHDRTFVATIAILGFPAAINARANNLRLPIGAARYTVAALLELPRYERTLVDFTIRHAHGSSQMLTDSGMLAIGNTRFFGGGMLACPDARANDGLLHLVSIEGVGRTGMLRHLAAKSGGSADRPEVLRTRGTVIELHTPDLEIWGDGEPVATTPATIRLVPKSLLVAGADPA